MPEAATTYARPARVAQAVGDPPVRVPRALARVRVAPRGRDARPADRGAADRHLPPRRRRLARGGRRRPFGRHDDGLHAARRARHGDAFRVARSRDSSCGSRSTPGCRRPSSPRPSSTGRGCSASPGRPTCGRSSTAEAAGDDDGRPGPRRLSAPPPRGDRRDGRRRSAASMRSCSPGASASARRAIRERGAPGPGVPRRRDRSGANEADGGRA